MIRPLHRFPSVVLSALAASLAACGSTTQTGPASTAPHGGTSTAAAGGAPTVVETNPPGDIPDNQAFVTYAGPGYTVTIPEGWARTGTGSATVFSDKYNSITAITASAPRPPSIASVRTIDLPRIAAASKGFVPGAVTTVRRTAGSAVLAKYHVYSAINPVTGKVADEAVERYAFWRAGKAVTLTLAAPVGSDNVDPWRKVTDSFSWT